MCGIVGASQAAHIHLYGQKSTGKKVNDNQVVPLCHVGANGCHEKVDAYKAEEVREKLAGAAQTVFVYF